MFRILLGILLSIACMGCGTGVDLGKADSTFGPFINAFEKDAAANGSPNLHVNLWIHFAVPNPTEREVVGECKNLDEIVIDPTWWHQFDSADGSVNFQQKALIYHELGHCVLGRQHRGGTFAANLLTATPSGGLNSITLDSSDDIPKSIMNADVISGIDFQAHEAYYLKELFLDRTLL